MDPVKCENCGKEINITSLKSKDKERFLSIGHNQDDNELCDKCFDDHEIEIIKYKEDNIWQT